MKIAYVVSNQSTNNIEIAKSISEHKILCLNYADINALLEKERASFDAIIFDSLNDKNDARKELFSQNTIDRELWNKIALAPVIEQTESKVISADLINNILVDNEGSRLENKYGQLFLDRIQSKKAFRKIKHSSGIDIPLQTSTNLTNLLAEFKGDATLTAEEITFVGQILDAPWTLQHLSSAQGASNFKSLMSHDLLAERNIIKKLPNADRYLGHNEVTFLSLAPSRTPSAPTSYRRPETTRFRFDFEKVKHEWVSAYSSGHWGSYQNNGVDELRIGNTYIIIEKNIDESFAFSSVAKILHFINLEDETHTSFKLAAKDELFKLRDIPLAMSLILIKMLRRIDTPSYQHIFSQKGLANSQNALNLYMQVFNGGYLEVKSTAAVSLAAEQCFTDTYDMQDPTFEEDVNYPPRNMQLKAYDWKETMALMSKLNESAALQRIKSEATILLRLPMFALAAKHYNSAIEYCLENIYTDILSRTRVLKSMSPHYLDYRVAEELYKQSEFESLNIGLNFSNYQNPMIMAVVTNNFDFFKICVRYGVAIDTPIIVSHQRFGAHQGVYNNLTDLTPMHIAMLLKNEKMVDFLHTELGVSKEIKVSTEMEKITRINKLFLAVKFSDSTGKQFFIMHAGSCDNLLFDSSYVGMPAFSFANEEDHLEATNERLKLLLPSNFEGPSIIESYNQEIDCVGIKLNLHFSAVDLGVLSEKNIQAIRADNKVYNLHDMPANKVDNISIQIWNNMSEEQTRSLSSIVEKYAADNYLICALLPALYNNDIGKISALLKSKSLHKDYCLEYDKLINAQGIIEFCINNRQFNIAKLLLDNGFTNTSAYSDLAETFKIYCQLHSDLEPKTLVHKLKVTYDELSDLYDMSARVCEIYPGGQHTILVLEELKQNLTRFNFKDVAMPTEFGDMQSYFIALVCLHDIGKGIGDVKDQHEHTLPILRKYMALWGFNSQQILLAEALVGHDIIGPALKAEQGVEDLKIRVKELNQKAQYCGLQLDKFFALQKLFFFSDAGSYPCVKNLCMKPSQSGLPFKFTKPTFDHLEQLIRSYYTNNNLANLSVVNTRENGSLSVIDRITMINNKLSNPVVFSKKPPLALIEGQFVENQITEEQQRKSTKNIYGHCCENRPSAKL